MGVRRGRHGDTAHRFERSISFTWYLQSDSADGGSFDRTNWTYATDHCLDFERCALHERIGSVGALEGTSLAPFGACAYMERYFRSRQLSSSCWHSVMRVRRKI